MIITPSQTPQRAPSIEHVGQPLTDDDMRDLYARLRKVSARKRNDSESTNDEVFEETKRPLLNNSPPPVMEKKKRELRASSESRLPFVQVRSSSSSSKEDGIVVSMRTSEFLFRVKMKV